MKVHLLLIASFFIFSHIAQADIISLAPQAKVVKSQLIPSRGLSMKMVRKKWGKPLRIHRSKGPVKHKWPRITRWDYPHYSIYFERHTVLHTVVHSNKR